MRKKLLSTSVVVLSLTLLLSGCSSAEDNVPVEDETSKPVSPEPTSTAEPTDDTSGVSEEDLATMDVELTEYRTGLKTYFCSVAETGRVTPEQYEAAKKYVNDFIATGSDVAVQVEPTYEYFLTAFDTAANHLDGMLIPDYIRDIKTTCDVAGV